jgi:peptidoglycan hydrolase CwlO-like protein
MTLTQKQKIMPIAMATLCIIVGVLTMLFVVYYANALNNQNQSRNQVAVLQTQNTNLNGQVSSLNTQLNTLTADKQTLQTQVNQLSQTVDSLSNQIAQMRAATTQHGSGAGKAFVS